VQPAEVGEGELETQVTSWWWFFFKVGIFFTLCFIGLLYLIYSNQERILYVPAQPIQFIA